MATVLIVDDQAAVRDALMLLFDLQGIAAESVRGPAEALARVRDGGVAVVVQDMNFTRDTTSGDEGVELFRAIRAIDPKMAVVLLTAWSSLPTAVMLVKEGANDYLQKPWDNDKLAVTVRALMDRREADRESDETWQRARVSRAELEKSFDLCGTVYVSRAMHEVVALAAHVARSDSAVLITGPNGSGKEKVAEIIQRNSKRRDAPFVRVNAGALPDALVEAELFGAEAGAFTGATKTRAGRFEAAHGGTIFLDEIGNLPLSGQMKLLRVLQTGDYERLGSTTTRRADVRVISATNVDLKAAIDAKTFREDLLFRLNVIEIAVPPLAARREDVLPLAEALLVESRAERTLTLSDAARDALRAHAWPGNVRELKNRIERAMVVATGDAIGPEDLALVDSPAATGSIRPSADDDPPLDRATLESALHRADGNVSRAAAELGVSRQALYRRMEKAGVVMRRRPKTP